MILSDRDIRKELESGRVVVDPLDEDAVQPASLDVRVGDRFLVFANHRRSLIDVRDPMDDLTEEVAATEDDPFILHPGEFVLGSTLEVIELPNDLVGRVEGKSSLGRLGLLIHSSLPASESVLFLSDGHLRRRTIGEIVKERLAGSVVSFDPETFEIGYHPVTGWYEGAADRIFEVRLRSGRSVRVTAGHNLFTIDREGVLQKTPTQGLRPGVRVAVPGRIRAPALATPVLDIWAMIPESEIGSIMVEGPSVSLLFREHRTSVAAALREVGIGHIRYYERAQRLPVSVARQFLPEGPSHADRLRFRGARRSLPVEIVVDDELAWLLGMYVAEGYQRRTQIVVSNTDESILDRVEAEFDALDLPTYRTPGKSITCMSTLFSALIRWLGLSGEAVQKRLPPTIYGWPDSLQESFLEGFIDGDGSREPERTSLWTSSPGLAADMLLLLSRLGRRAAAYFRSREETVGLFQIAVPHREHKLLTAVPLADRLLVRLRHRVGLSQREAAAAAAGYRHPTDLCSIEKRTGGTAVRKSTLSRLLTTYRARQDSAEGLERLTRLVDGDLLWDEVVEVRDTGRVEPVYDIEVRPGGRHIENFLAGDGGVFVSNTAGFVDAGFQGHLTLELSNVANLPIAIYPGMRIGQLCLFRMTSPAERPYGSPELGSKYQGQRGPTASRYSENYGGEDE